MSLTHHVTMDSHQATAGSEGTLESVSGNVMTHAIKHMRCIS